MLLLQCMTRSNACSTSHYILLLAFESKLQSLCIIHRPLVDKRPSPSLFPLILEET